MIVSRCFNAATNTATNSVSRCFNDWNSLKNKNADVKTLSDLIKQKLPKRNKYTSVV